MYFISFTHSNILVNKKVLYLDRVGGDSCFPVGEMTGSLQTWGTKKTPPHIAGRGLTTHLYRCLMWRDEILADIIKNIS